MHYKPPGAYVCITNLLVHMCALQPPWCVFVHYKSLGAYVCITNLLVHVCALTPSGAYVCITNLLVHICALQTLLTSSSELYYNFHNIRIILEQKGLKGVSHRLG